MHARRQRSEGPPGEGETKAKKGKGTGSSSWPLRSSGEALIHRQSDPACRMLGRIARMEYVQEWSFWGPELPPP